MNMKKYLVTCYVVENGFWFTQGCYTLNSSEFVECVRTLEKSGFSVSMSNIFVRTYTSDSNKHLAYSIVECPKL